MFRLDVELIPVAKRNFQLERLAFVIRTELNSRDHPQRHLAMECFHSVQQHGLDAFPLDKSREVGRFDSDSHPIIEADNDILGRLQDNDILGHLQEEHQNEMDQHKKSVNHGLNGFEILQSVAP